MTFYDDMAQTAADMLAEFGQVVTISRTTPGTYDTATGKNGSPTVQTWTVSALDEAYDARQIDGTLVLSGDRRVTVSSIDTSGAALGPVAVEDDITMGDGSTGKIKAVEPFSPGGTVLYTVLRVRR